MVSSPITKVFVTMLVASLFFVSMNIALGEFIGTGDYNVTISDELQGDLNNFTASFDEIAQKSSSIQNKTKGTQSNQDNTFGLNLDSALQAISVFWDSFGLTKNMLSTLEVRLGIPSIFIFAFIAAMVFSISIIVIGILTRSGP